MSSSRRPTALLSALLMLPLALSACGGGGGVPSDAVVRIGPDTIKKTAFDHWLVISARQAATTAAAAAVPDPPSSTKCIAGKKKTALKPAKGQPVATAGTYKAQCQQEYAKLRDQAMQFLISSAWTVGESADRGVKVSDADVKKDFDKQLAQAFPQRKNYEAFLKQTGYVQEDLLYQIKIQKLNSMLRAKVLEGADKVTPAQIANYYNKNKDKFAVPEKRDIRIVLTKTEDKADEAKSALAGGRSWTAVVASYSIDRTTRAEGGLLAGISKGQLAEPLDDAMFSATKGEVGGPIKTRYGYVIFTVEKITPGLQQTLKQSKAVAAQQLISQQQTTKVDAFQKDFEKKWKARTECQKGYAMQSCKNAPKVQPTTGAPSGTATAGGSSSGGATTNK